MSAAFSVERLRSHTDERLLALAREGDGRAFEALVDRYHQPLLAYCRRLLPTGARAEDALQQGLLQAWVALERGAEVEAVRPWLYRIMRNTAVKSLQNRDLDHVPLDHALVGADPPHAELEQRIELKTALAGIAELPDLQRQALLQTVVLGHSQRRVAAHLGVSEPAVRGLVYRARTALRSALGAISPLPLVAWLVRITRKVPPSDSAIAGGPGGVAITGALAKTGAIMLATGTLIAAGHARHPARPTRSATRGTTIVRVPLVPSAARAATPSASALTTSTSASGAQPVGAGRPTTPSASTAAHTAQTGWTPHKTGGNNPSASTPPGSTGPAAGRTQPITNQPASANSGQAQQASGSSGNAATPAVGSETDTAPTSTASTDATAPTDAATPSADTTSNAGNAATTDSATTTTPTQGSSANTPTDGGPQTTG